MADYTEEDYQPIAAPAAASRFLDGTHVEIARPLDRRPLPRHALFDFDGTLSLIREGWQAVMVPMMVEMLLQSPKHESPEQLREIARGFVMELTGKQTIYQMIRLAEEITRRGGKPLPPEEYKQIYHDRLMLRIVSRREDLRAGKASPQSMLVRGSLEMLQALRCRGVALYLASGTDEQFVREEAHMLGLDPYFGGHIYGAIADYRSFSKAKVIERILAQHQVPGEILIGFGDGYVEIQNIKAVGGIAIAVASDEANRSGRPDAWKRDRLIGAGADLVIPDFAQTDALLNYIWQNAAK